jgi:hypothetical protein
MDFLSREYGMENDSVRTSGDSTLVEIWIDGKLRDISVSRAAIEAHLRLPPDKAAVMTEYDRREFVRTHLTLVVNTATAALRSANPDADAVTIEPGQLGGHVAAARSGERRHTDRRKGERRKTNLGPPPSGERRR